MGGDTGWKRDGIGVRFSLGAGVFDCGIEADPIAFFPGVLFCVEAVIQFGRVQFHGGIGGDGEVDLLVVLGIGLGSACELNGLKRCADSLQMVVKID